MRHAHYRLIPLVVLSAALLAVCGQQQSAVKVADIGVGVYADTATELPRLRYAAGEVTINDRCPVRKVSLNRRLSPLFVNGRPLGFC